MFTLATLLHADLGGKAHVLWRPKNLGVGEVTPSPDGKRLAIAGFAFTSDTWMIENF
jgi:hypothetical protein